LDNHTHEILSDLFERLNNGHSSGEIRFTTNSLEKKQLIEDVEYLKEIGLINVIAFSSGFVDIELTSFGIDYMEQYC
jgi:hypothetical protein